MSKFPKMMVPAYVKRGRNRRRYSHVDLLPILAPHMGHRGVVLNPKFWEREIPSKQFFLDNGMVERDLDFFRPSSRSDIKRDVDESFAWGYVRQPFTSMFSFAMPCREAIDFIASHSRSIVEVGAGTGFWASLLARAGVDIVATDIGPEGGDFQQKGTHFPVLKQEATDAVLANPERDLLVIWPYKGPWLTRAVKALAPSKLVIFCGEFHEHMGADAEFFDMVRNVDLFEPIASFDMVRFSGMRDWMVVVRKRGGGV